MQFHRQADLTVDDLINDDLDDLSEDETILRELEEEHLVRGIFRLRFSTF